MGLANVAPARLEQPHVRLRGGPYDGNLAVPFDREIQEVAWGRCRVMVVGEALSGEGFEYRALEGSLDDDGHPILVAG